MNSERKLYIGAIIAIALIISFVGWISFTHAGRAAWNLWTGSVQKVDDATNYETKKVVEDTCRAMVASYESDRLTWEQYKDADTREKRNWAEQAKMRANKTAANFNNYILKNSHVWSGNIPDDIKESLDYLQ